jgi:hypothetical protein
MGQYLAIRGEIVPEPSILVGDVILKPENKKPHNTLKKYMHSFMCNNFVAIHQR